MMRLSTMCKVDSTVDAEDRSPVAGRILEAWEHDRGSARFFRSSANFVYIFHANGNRRFLRFADSSERDREGIEAEVDILRWLDTAGLRVAGPLQSRTGEFVETATTDHGTFHAVVFDELRGAQYDIEELDDAQFRAWGAALGKLHATLRNYSSAGLVSRGTWRDRLRQAAEQIPPHESVIQREMDQIASALDALPVNHDNYGMVHFDFELDNLLWQDRSIGIVDFDDCAHCWYVADIAFALRDLFKGGADMTNRSFCEFVQGYRAHHPVDDKLLAHIPMFLRFADLVTYARLARALDLPDNGQHPNWLRVLRRRLEGKMAEHRYSLQGGGL